VHAPGGGPSDEEAAEGGRGVGAAGGADGSGEGAADAELRATRRELGDIAVADIVANHAVGLWQLAVLHLTPEPQPDGTPVAPRLAEAALAIDALGALVDGVGDRLGDHADELREAVTQLRLVYVALAQRAGQ
jgi:hypothetical protein